VSALNSLDKRSQIHYNILKEKNNQFMKNLYIVDYWVPFPQSEYGGIINVIAETDSEVFEILAEDETFNSTYINRIMPNVKKAQRLPLSEDFESGIIEAFVT
tara:strand:+ start:463 stop:768 length:306 start_codon:yes stop_codon:yes gene_type:complete